MNEFMSEWMKVIGECNRWIEMNAVLKRFVKRDLWRHLAGIQMLKKFTRDGKPAHYQTNHRDILMGLDKMRVYYF